MGPEWQEYELVYLDFSSPHDEFDEITNILEARGVMVYFQLDKDWFYRSEERRWISLNDNSGWRRGWC